MLYDSAPLKHWAQTHPNAVLAPTLLANWNRMVDETAEALRFSLGDDATSLFEQQPPVSAVLEDILIAWCSTNPEKRHAAEQAWNKLQKLGFVQGDLEFHDCGREALVFRIRCVNDALLKVSEFHELKDNPYVLCPAAKILLPPTRQHASLRGVSLALVPYLRNDHKGNPLTAESISYDPLQHIQSKVADKIDIKLNAWRLEEILRDAGMNFLDKKTLNMRCVPSYPNLPIIIDKRAVENNGEHSSFGTQLSREMLDNIHAAYTDLQKQIAAHYAKTYGKGENCFKAVARASHQDQGLSKGRPLD